MSKKKLRINFASKLHLACSSDDYRPAMQCITFENGFAYASDTHVLIKQALSISEFDEAAIEIMNGKQIHKNVFKRIFSHDIIQIVDEGVLADQDGSRVLYQWIENDWKIPNYEKVIQDAIKDNKKRSSEEIGMSLNLIKRFSDIFAWGYNKGHVSFKIGQPNKPVIIYAKFDQIDINTQVGIIMPYMLNN